MSFIDQWLHPPQIKFQMPLESMPSHTETVWQVAVELAAHGGPMPIYIDVPIILAVARAEKKDNIKRKYKVKCNPPVLL